MQVVEEEKSPFTNTTSAVVDHEDDASDGDTGPPPIGIHPLVVINLSDHHIRSSNSRNASSASSSSPPVLGVLYGTRNSSSRRQQSISLMDSFEVVWNNDTNTLNIPYIKSRHEQFAQVFPQYELLGWYTIGNEVTSWHHKVQKQISNPEWNENPLLLLLDPNTTSSTSEATTTTSAAQLTLPTVELPIQCFESEMHVVNTVPTRTFVKSSFVVQTSEIERITIDHVSKAASSDNADGVSSLLSDWESVKNAIHALKSRMSILHSFVEEMKSGTIPMEYNIVREIASICHKLPLRDDDDSIFTLAFNREAEDSLAITHLTALTKSLSCANSIVEKFGILYDNENGGSTTSRKSRRVKSS